VLPRNAKSKLLAHVATQQNGLYCGKIIGEYLEKLIDRGHPPERASEMVAYIMGAFQRVALVTKASPFPPADPDDEVFLLCAIDGQAHYLVTDDGHLLDLKDKYSAFKIGSIEALGLSERQ
jgi:predicted nucleic acid-binding protein